MDTPSANPSLTPRFGIHGRLLSIGAFSSASGLSQKALRLYDRQSLLRPAYTDPDSGYRYYRADQLDTAALIRRMRQMEIPLAKIRRLLAATPSEAGNMLITYWTETEARAARHRRVKDELLGCLQQLQQEKNAMTTATEPTVTQEEIAPQLTLSISKRVKIDVMEDHMAESVARLRRFAAEAGAAEIGEPVRIFHGPVNHDDDGPLEICLPVRGAFMPSGDIVARELPGGTAVRVVGTGEYCDFPKVLELYDKAACWINQNGFQPAEPPRERWVVPEGDDKALEVVWRYQ